MMSGDRLGLKFPDICLMGEEKPQKNLTQETCPDRESNPGPLRERRIRYPLLHNGKMRFRVFLVFNVNKYILNFVINYKYTALSNFLIVI
ncbi:hypothetical protein C0J52_23757 [Blattella germanica]|nr:hypothetical protein C0J52_23757 [Blattella germanica]